MPYTKRNIHDVTAAAAAAVDALFCFHFNNFKFINKENREMKRKKENKIMFIMNKDEMKQYCDNGNFSMILNLFFTEKKTRSEKKKQNIDLCVNSQFG